MPTYQSRRTYLSELFTPLVRRIKDNASTAPEPTRWERVDRTVDEMRARLAEANNEEQFQAVGLLGREALISLAQSVYDPQRHPAEYEGVKISATDAQRMLEVYFATDLAGGNNQEARAHAKSALKLALALQHRRTADFRHAALCVEATTSVINIVAIISGRRDPT